MECVEDVFASIGVDDVDRDAALLDYDDSDDDCQKRRTRTIIVLTAVAFVGMLLLDGLAQLNGLPQSEEVDGNKEVSIMVQRKGWNGNTRNGNNKHENLGIMRRLVRSLVSDTTNSHTVPSHRSYYDHQDVFNSQSSNKH